MLFRFVSSIHGSGSTEKESRDSKSRDSKSRDSKSRESIESKSIEWNSNSIEPPVPDESFGPSKNKEGTGKRIKLVELVKLLVELRSGSPLEVAEEAD